MNEYLYRADRNLSVSSHLTPDPEKRLGRMLDNLSRQQNMADFKLCTAAAIAAIEMFAVYPSHTGTEFFLSIVILLALFGISPITEKSCCVKFLDRDMSELPDDYLIDENDLSKYSRSELVNFLDKYLGGGISATPYYEDLVSRISYSALALLRKKYVYLACFAVMSVAQICACVSFFL